MKILYKKKYKVNSNNTKIKNKKFNNYLKKVNSYLIMKLKSLKKI